MKIIQICPKCGIPGISVNKDAIAYNLRKPPEQKSIVKLKWRACINPECDCSYFAGDRIFSISDMKSPLFYKDKSDLSPVCYCSDLSRGEIINAVQNGCKSIREVRNFTKKKVTGHCQKRNPLGKCCKQVVLKTIKDAQVL
jgi:bacterioferritin-associated ferredoxin